MGFFSGGIFSPGFFASGFFSGGTAGAATANTLRRDADVIRDVIDRLTITGSFDGVYWGELPERRGRPADVLAMAVVEPDSWAETDEFDDFSDYQSVPRNTFKLTLMTRNPDPETRDRSLDRLACVARNAVNEQSLAGVTIPGLTILRRGKWSPASNPERRMTIIGEYAYFVDGASAHNTDD
jgi:hypothetical protein